MEVVRLPGYTEGEKLRIARRFLLPKQVAAHVLAEKTAGPTGPAAAPPEPAPGGDSGGSPYLTVADGVLLHTIRHYTREAGVRSLERSLAALCRAVAVRVAAWRAARAPPPPASAAAAAGAATNAKAAAMAAMAEATAPSAAVVSGAAAGGDAGGDEDEAWEQEAEDDGAAGGESWREAAVAAREAEAAAAASEAARIVGRLLQPAGMMAAPAAAAAAPPRAAAAPAAPPRPPTPPPRFPSVEVTKRFVADVLGPPKFESELALRTSTPGVATGLAWTAAGG